jgi:hypothetical protein
MAALMRFASGLAFAALNALAATLALAPAECAAQADEPAEQQIKVAFLYKFASYVDWPANAFAGPDSPLVIGVMGADELADELAAIVVRRPVNGRLVMVRKLRRGAPLTGVQILFVARAESARHAEIVAPLKGQPVLVVTESEQAFPPGSMINFVPVGDKIRFDVDPTFAERGNLKISARLLSVARKVVAKPS